MGAWILYAAAHERFILDEDSYVGPILNRSNI